jgi:TPR repeat protein
VKAVEWYRKAAEQGNAHAQFCLGVTYSTGEGGIKYSVKAMEWLRKAAEQGHGDAQYYLGNGYAEGGEGVPKDEIEALAWFNIVAAAGREDAIYNRGKMETQVGRAGTLTAQQRSREILKEIEAVKAARASTKGKQ